MKIFIGCCLLITSLSLKAQSKIFERPFNEFSKKPSLNNNLDFNQQKKILSLQNNINIKPVQPTDAMVLKVPEIKLAYLHNYNHFDTYKADQDNMYVVKPDSTIHFNMPVAGNTIVMNELNINEPSSPK